jgi:hypothetical protein
MLDLRGWRRAAEDVSLSDPVSCGTSRLTAPLTVPLWWPAGPRRSRADGNTEIDLR